MALVVFDHVGGFDAALAEGVDHLVGFGFDDPWVVGALGDEERGGDFIDVVDGGGGFE